MRRYGSRHHRCTDRTLSDLEGAEYRPFGKADAEARRVGGCRRAEKARRPLLGKIAGQMRQLVIGLDRFPSRLKLEYRCPKFSAWHKAAVKGHATAQARLLPVEAMMKRLFAAPPAVVFAAPPPPANLKIA